MSRTDYGDFHDHAAKSFNDTLDGVKIKGLKFDAIKATIDSTLKGKVTASVDYDRKKDYFLMASVKANSCGDFKPSVTYEKGEHKMVTNYNDVSLKYQYKVAAIGGAITTNLIDGLCSEMHASTVFNTNYQAGFSATYDPSRSGLKKLSYGVLARNPSWWTKGSVSLTVDGPKAYRLGLSYQCCPPVVLSAMWEKLSEGTLGFKYTSTCGGNVTAYANTKGFFEKLEIGTTINKNVRGYDVTIGALVNPKTMSPKCGLTLEL